MEFNKPYNRSEFLNFLQNNFLPDDFVPSIEEDSLRTKVKYTSQITKLGMCPSLDLVVYELQHKSHHEARVSLSKEAFRFLADEMAERALVIFVPENDFSTYRFSLIEITLDISENSARITRAYSNPRRLSHVLGQGIAYYTPNKYLNSLGRVVNAEDLYDRFSVEKLTKEFYGELSDWYAWAIKEIKFPNNLEDDTDNEKFNHESAIRMITRLIFIWFLKQRGLVPNEFFDEKYLSDNLLKNFYPNKKLDMFYKSTESIYYKAILQNLFFAMLNSPMTKEGSKDLTERRFRKDRKDYDNNKLMRYEKYFKAPQLFVKLANRQVPFLNGGLFDCLDDKDNGLYYDGFSDREKVSQSLVVPDYLFFGEPSKTIDLSDWYGDKNKKSVSAHGLIDILKTYNFTVEENTPFDQDVALDPELLGKVFENLLASYNPETQVTARKQTGSFYTPREIVQYMVDESLIAHLKRTVGNELEDEYRKLLSYSDETLNLNKEQRRAVLNSLYKCKILDPACGSGAFPMGVLQQMVHILNELDPDNAMWKEMMMEQAINETSHAYKNATPEERATQISDIERSFDETINKPDYARKLYLIENCIYGVDIQPIAIQISKLRFFISLVIDQKILPDKPEDNFGIRPLPNLEAKFVAANTLIGLTKQKESLFEIPEITDKMQQMKEAKHKIFGAKTVRTKRKYKEILLKLRQDVSRLLQDNHVLGNEAALQLAVWDMFDQNASSPFFDSEWMFNIKNGFDIVIANPPYIDSETMTQSNPKMREIYSSLYSCAAGNWDMFVPFVQKGSSLAHATGLYSFIIPNKIVAAKYASKLRDFINSQYLIEIRDYSRVDVFENAAVYPCTIVVSKNGIQSHIAFTTMSDRTHILSTFSISRTRFSEIKFWDIFFQPASKVAILDKYFTKTPLSLDPELHIYGAATVAEAYLIKDVLRDSQDTGDSSFQMVNTGTIDPYTNLWGISAMQYIKHKYICPHLEKADLRQINGTRFEQASANKIIIAGMSKQIEAIYDQGQFLAGKSTTIITGPEKKLRYLLGLLNSALISYCFSNQFNSLKMAGSFINVGTRELKSLFIPTFQDTPLQKLLVEKVSEILKTKEKNPLNNTSGLEHTVNLLVDRLYNLSYEQACLVEPGVNIDKEEYDHFSL